MSCKIEFAHSASKDLKRVPKRMAGRIINKLQFFASQKDPLKFAKKLTDSRFGEYRFRVGDYRILFDLEADETLRILLILAVQQRKDIYRMI